jgi:OmcA/MtrC family decaheme c-type cytochrome
MRIGVSGKWTARLGLLAGLLLASFYLVSADGPEYTTDQKAYYADAAQVAFVRPGLVFKIVSATIASDGTVQVRYTISDPKGLPLDRNGVYTPGVVSRSFILASIPKGQTQYLSYTTRTQTSPITGVSAVQAGADSGGTTVDNSIGDYTYTFKTKLPSSYDKTATHTIGLYGNRNLTEFDLGTNLADTTFSWVPNGSPVTVTRDVIKTLTCNKCHQDLSAHGSTGRKSLELCVLCHQPQTIDPDTGNSVDMPVMAHKIHMGEELPSVIAGTPYQIIGNAQSVADFSTVVFPADPRRCTFCHEQNTGAAQKLAYLRPNIAACGACHDNVNFATGENHQDIVQTSSKECILCHQGEGEFEFDGSVTGAHTIPAFSKELPGVVIELKSITNTAPGAKPTVTFTLKDKSGNAIPFAQMGRVRFQVAGPNTDYPATVNENASAPIANPDGSLSYTFKASPIPAGSKGSFTLGVEAYRNITIQAGFPKEQIVRDFVLNTQLAFSVDGSPVVARRTVVATDNCNKCHAFLSLHGGNRNTVGECVMCHNPNATAANPDGADLPANSIDFRLMVHKIHTGEELTNPYKIGNSNFNEVRFPGDRRRCNACHVNNSQQLPLDAGLLKVQDPNGYISPAGPVTAACTSCHTTLEAASHADINTGRLGESCTVCHGASADFSVDKVHAQ